MKTRNASITLTIIILVLLYFFLKRTQEPRQKEMVNRNPAQLAYSSLATCEMECLGVDSAEVGEVLEKGIINMNESNRRGRPCPQFTLQHKTDAGHSLRILISQCTERTVVISCYLAKDSTECDCPPAKNKIQGQ